MCKGAWHMSVNYSHAGASRVQKRCQVPGRGVTDDGKSSCGCSQPNLGPQQEH